MIGKPNVIETLAGKRSSPNKPNTARAKTVLSAKESHNKMNVALNSHTTTSNRHSPSVAKRKIQLRVTIDDGVPTMTVAGRYAWCLKHLLETGECGCTPIERPAPRWSHYVWVLRGLGFEIETITEPHDGPYSGTHARYVLRSKVRILEDCEVPA